MIYPAVFHRSSVGLVFLCLLISVVGCSTPGTAVKKNEKELLLLEETANQGRDQFFKGEYADAAATLLPCAAEQHVNQPLYKCELASIYLLSDDKKKAEEQLKDAIHLLEVFYDQSSEKRAASLWGRESEKVYKGDPYERATLYTLYGMVLLEKGEVDNALASFKRALLMDGDTEKNQYQSDFGLVQFLAAKCYDLRAEAAQRDVMLKAACDSFLSLPGMTNSFPLAIKQDYELARHASTNSMIRPPAKMLATLFSWGGVDAICERYNLPPEIRDWLSQNIPADKGLQFNTLLVGWDGEGPSMSRAGEYGEKRMIHSGYRHGDYRQAYSCYSKNDLQPIDNYPWLGNISYQATTRGGRKMDNVLESKASFKGATDTAGNVMIAGGLTGLAIAGMNSSSDASTMIVFGAIALGGLLFKGVSALTETEADIRCWRCLPHEYSIVSMVLPEGETELMTEGWVFTMPIAGHPVKVIRDKNAPVTFVHYVTPHLGKNADFCPGYFDGKGSAFMIQSFYIAHPNIADPNNDGELSPEERTQINAEMLKFYDTDGNGVIDLPERKQLYLDANTALRKRMGVL